MRGYVATVHAKSIYTDNNDCPTGRVDHGYWVLYIGLFNRRRAKLIGDPGPSSGALKKKTDVQAWLLGGPLPASADVGPNLNAPKTAPSPHKKSLKLIVGGKS